MNKIIQIPVALIIFGLSIFVVVYFYSSSGSSPIVKSYNCSQYTKEECPSQCDLGGVPCSVFDSESDSAGLGLCRRTLCVEKTACENYTENECIYPRCQFFENECYKHTYEIKNSKIIDGSEIPKEVKNSIPPKAEMMEVSKARSKYSNFYLMTSYRFYKDVNIYSGYKKHISLMSHNGEYYGCPYGSPFEAQQLCPKGYTCVEGAAPGLIDGRYRGHCIKD